MTITDNPAGLDHLRDAPTEKWLTENRIAFTFDPAVELDQIDQAASLSNQARLEALADEVVDRYAADMDRGNVFPPVLALKRSRRARLTLLGGNHRLAATRKLDRSTIAAYVVDVEPEMATRLMYEDNRRHGLAPSEAERIRQAIHLIDQGYTQQAAAEVVGVPAPKISIERSVQKSTARAAQVGLSPHAFGGLAKNSRYQLSLVRSDPVFTELARLAIDARLGVEDVRRLTVAVRDARSDAAAIDLIAEEARTRTTQIERTAGGQVKRSTPRAKLSNALSAIRCLDPADVANACSSAEQVDTLLRQIKAARAELADVALALKT